jgi:hypothetical protein
MAVSELAPLSLRLAARRAYERGRMQGALRRGAVAALLASPSFLMCNSTAAAAACLAGFAIVVAAGRLRGGEFEDGTRAGAIAGILPCLLPAAIRAVDPQLCVLLSSRGPWICAFGGIAAGVALGLRGSAGRGWAFWSSALAALAFPAALGCLPAGAMGFLGLAIGLVAGGAPALASRRAVA